MKWFRFYSEAIHDPKLLSVRPELRWYWLMLLCVASEHTPRGRVPFSGQNVRSLAALLGQKPHRLAAYIAQLVQAGLFDVEDGFLIPHGWNKRQFASDDSKERVREHREQAVTVTPPDTDTDNRYRETDTDSLPPTPLGLVERTNIFILFERTFGFLNPTLVPMLKEWETEYPLPWLEEAFGEARANAANNWRYVGAILKRWQEEDNAASG